MANNANSNTQPTAEEVAKQAQDALAQAKADAVAADAEAKAKADALAQAQAYADAAQKAADDEVLTKAATIAAQRQAANPPTVVINDMAGQQPDPVAGDAPKYSNLLGWTIGLVLFALALTGVVMALKSSSPAKSVMDSVPPPPLAASTVGSSAQIGEGCVVNGKGFCSTITPCDTCEVTASSRHSNHNKHAVTNKTAKAVVVTPPTPIATVEKEPSCTSDCVPPRAEESTFPQVCKTESGKLYCNFKWQVLHTPEEQKQCGCKIAQSRSDGTVIIGFMTAKEGSALCHKQQNAFVTTQGDTMQR